MEETNTSNNNTKELDITENLDIKFLDKTKFNVFRLDGHNFSKLTKQNFEKPFDKKFNDAMKKCAQVIFDEYKFQLGFVGSDEISLVYYPIPQDKIDNGCQYPYNGKLFKLLSIMPSLISSQFTLCTGLLNSFDCRHFEYNDEETMKEYLVSRRLSVIKNSKMMLAQSYYSQNKLHGVTSNDAIKMLKEEKNIDYFDVVDEDIRRGLFLLNIKEQQNITIKYTKKNETEERVENKTVEKKKVIFEDSSDITFEKCVL